MPWYYQIFLVRQPWACLAADPCLWADNVDVLSVLLDDLFLKLLEKNDA